MFIEKQSKQTTQPFSGKKHEFKHIPRSQHSLRSMYPNMQLQGQKWPGQYKGDVSGVTKIL